MTTRPSSLRALLVRFRDEEDGVTLTELALALALFLALAFAILDFGRMGGEYVLTEKALQKAARLAVVRPPVCSGVPDAHTPLNPSSPADIGTLCKANSGSTCATISVSCTGDLTNETFQEIWFGPDRVDGGVPGIREILPGGATPSQLRFRYVSDSNLGFLGGPLVPVVTVENNPDNRLQFQTVFPLFGLLNLRGAGAPADADSSRRFIPVPLMSVSLPGEDLSHRPPS